MISCCNKLTLSKVEDDKRIKSIQLKTEADSLVHTAEARLKEHQDQEYITETDKKIEKLIASLGIALETNNQKEIQSSTQELKEVLGTTNYSPFDLGGLGGIFDGIFRTPQVRQNPHIKKQPNTLIQYNLILVRSQIAEISKRRHT